MLVPLREALRMCQQKDAREKELLNDVSILKARHAEELQQERARHAAEVEDLSRRFGQERDELRARLDDRERRARIREQLGAFLSEGHNLLELAANQLPPPQAAADQWGARAEAFLREYAGGSYVARFRTDAGIPPIMRTGVPEASQGLWRGISTRLVRLQEFLAEAGG
jgi:hypothetical protein